MNPLLDDTAAALIMLAIIGWTVFIYKLGQFIEQLNQQNQPKKRETK